MEFFFSLLMKSFKFLFVRKSFQKKKDNSIDFLNQTSLINETTHIYILIITIFSSLLLFHSIIQYLIRFIQII